MKVRQECSKLVKPIYQGDPPSTTEQVSLSVFDLITYDAHIPLIYAYTPPTPSNAALELGLRMVLSEYRELAGRFACDDYGHRVLLLNDEGARLVEASASCTLDQAMIQKPSPALLSLHPFFFKVKELTLIQLTRFTCGSLVVGVSTNHMVADGRYVSHFLVAWGQACRGLKINRRSFYDRNIFVPRDPPGFEFMHKGAEFKSRNDDCPLQNVGDLVMRKFQFSPDFLSKIKSKASSIFEILVAHIWKTVAKACERDGYKYTCLKIAVNGITRLDQRIPKEYFGNIVLWAYPRAEMKTLLNKPLKYGAKVIHDAVAKVNDNYFKSFIDFACHKVDEEDLVPKLNFTDTVACLNLNIDSWLRFPFCDLDFGCGRPHIFTPSYRLFEGQVYLVPSIDADAGIDVFLALHENQMDSFKRICYSLH